jgi:hypothetical protein
LSVPDEGYSILSVPDEGYSSVVHTKFNI